MRKVLLTTGGTGGHIFPALAVAEVLQKQQDVTLLFVGSLYGPEKDIVPKAGIEFVGLPVRGILGRGLKSLKALLQMGKALGMARKIIKEFQPDVAMGFGGYAAFAPILAAKLCKVPTAIHEQNAVVGLSNKMLGKLVDKIFLSLPLQAESKVFDANKCIVTGNPVRQALAQVGKSEHDFSGKRLLILGGSQGAQALNDVIAENLAYLQSMGIQLWHQTGLKDEQRVKKAYAAQGMNADKVQAFIDNIHEAYAWADLVMCRAGASTVAELAAGGRGAVFVPFPFATHDHQTANAQLLVNLGAAKVFAEKNMREQNIIQEVVALLQNSEQLQKMGTAAYAQSKVQAAQDIVLQLQKMCNGQG